ncbi:MAG: hypothetical protein AAF847_18970, partial [Bacteroidota bacterium]
MRTDLAQTDIIYFTLFPWDHPYSSVSLSFTRAFAENHRVFYVNPPFSVKEMVQRINHPTVKRRLNDQFLRRMRYEKIPGLPDNVIAAHPPAILPINFLPKGKLYQNLHQWNNKVVFQTIAKI